MQTSEVLFLPLISLFSVFPYSLYLHLLLSYLSVFVCVLLLLLSFIRRSFTLIPRWRILGD